MFKSKLFKGVLVFLLIVVAGLYGYYQIWFLRMPDRNIPHDTAVFIAPANGTVRSVKAWHKGTVKIEKETRSIDVYTTELGDSGMVVSIEMNVDNVHYQRAPIKGRYISSFYREGEFRNALIHNNPYSMRFENEFNAMLFESVSGTRYKVVQIAGLVARRIVDYMTPKSQEVEQGDVIGLIKLGSQVSLIFPHGVAIQVEVGQVTIDGETIIAKDN